MIDVERVDFVSFLTQDIPRAKRFYSEVLELEIETEGEHDLEFRAGQVTLDVFDPRGSDDPSRQALRGSRFAYPTSTQPRRARGEGSRVRRRDRVDTGVCHMGFVKDPDGNVLILHRRYSPRVHRIES